MADSKNCPPDIIIQPVVNHNGKEYRVIEVSQNAFHYCQNTRNLTIPEGIEKIGYRAFYVCQMHIKQLVLPQSLKIIKQLGLSENFIDEIYIGSNLEEFEDVAFARSQIKKIVVDPNNQYF